MRAGFGLSALVILLLAGATVMSRDPVSPPPPSWSMRDAIGNVGFDYQWGSSGMLMTANFTINNKNDYDVKDIEITCIHSAPSGTVIDSNTRTIYETFQARSKRSIRNFKMGFIHDQAKRSGCRIVRLAKSAR
jgi:hypothetical protein